MIASLDQSEPTIYWAGMGKKGLLDSTQKVESYQFAAKKAQAII